MARVPLDQNAPPDRLWEEIGRLQRFARKTEDQRDAALRQLADTEQASATAGLAGESFINRPALSDLRRLARDFGDVLLRLPTIRKARGFGAAVAKMGELLADLDLLELDKPRGIQQVFDRHQLRRFLTHPSYQSMLSSPGPAGDYLRRMLIARVNNVYVRGAARRVFEKSTEHFEETKRKGR
jgi:hypothetical protein